MHLPSPLSSRRRAILRLSLQGLLLTGATASSFGQTPAPVSPASAGATTTAPAAADPAAPAPVPGAAELLKRLKDLKENRARSFSDNVARFAAEISAAAQSSSTAEDLYEKCIQSVNYEGKNRDAQEFSQWRTAEHDKLANRIFQSALQLQLSWISLTLRRVAGEPVKNLLPEVMSTLDRVTALNNEAAAHGADPQIRAKQWKWTKEIINQPITDSIFVKFYRLDGHLAGAQGWEMSPGKMDGIYDTIIMPYYAAAKDPAIVQAWDERIARVQSLLPADDTSANRDKFDNETLPTMMWKRARAMATYADRTAGANEMFALIEKYPSHPNYDKWIAEMERVLKGGGAGEADTSGG